MKIANSTRPLLPLLGVLAFTLAGSSVWAQGSALGADASRAIERAERLIQAGQHKAAALEFERASELAGGSCPECLLGVGRAYCAAGDSKAALQVTRIALSQLTSPENRARAYDQLGYVLARSGDLEAAREAFRKAVELDSGLAAQVRSSLANALLENASTGSKAQEASSDSSETLSLLGPSAP
jgi:Flp pilus assembly protein TadD